MKILPITQLSAEAPFPIHQSGAAHPLFPPGQAFLWLPGFEGEEQPYCTYNEFRPHPAALDIRRLNRLPERDENGIPYTPPYPVSPETFITWHTHVSPPYPYHPVPVVRPLTSAEMNLLGQSVIRLGHIRNADASHPLRYLTAIHKAAILTALAEFDLLGKCPALATPRHRSHDARHWPHSA